MPMTPVALPVAPARERPETILLVGGSGFLGSNLGQALMDQGYRIVVADLVPPRWDPVAYAGRGSFVRAALGDLGLFSNLLASHRIDTVLHLASFLLPGSSLDDLCRELPLNLEPSLRLVELFQNRGVRRLVFLSTGGAIYGAGATPRQETDPLQPLNYYGWMKLAFEEFIRLRSRLAAMDYLILRPSNPYGRYQNLRGRQGLVSVILGKILDQAPLEIWGDGSVVRDYLHIDDFCQAVLALLGQDHWNQTLNLGSGVGHSIRDLIACAEGITGRALTVDYQPARSVDTPTAVLDIGRLQACIPFTPLTLEAGLRRYWQHILEQQPS